MKNKQTITVMEERILDFEISPIDNDILEAEQKKLESLDNKTVDKRITKMTDEEIKKMIEDDCLTEKEIEFFEPCTIKEEPLLRKIDPSVIFNENIKTKKVKDWSDYVIMYEKYICDGVDIDTGITYNTIDVYYNIHDIPFPGDGYFETSDLNYKEITLDEYLKANVFNKYKNNPYIRVNKYIQF